MLARRLLPLLLTTVVLTTAPWLARPAVAQRGGVSPLCRTGCGGNGSSPVSVTPSDSGAWVLPGGALDSVAFTVKNTGSTYSDVYNLTFTCTTLSCPASGNPNPAGPLSLGPGSGATVYVKFYDPSTTGGSGTITLTADDNSDQYFSTGTYTVTADAPTVTLVTPAANGANGRAIVHTRQPVLLATYSDGLSGIDTTSLVLKLGGVDVTSLARRNQALMEWEVDSTHELVPGDSVDLYVQVCNVSHRCSSLTRRTVLDNSGPPIVALTGMPLEAQGRQFSTSLGAGLSATGPEIEAGLGVPSYVAMGTAQATGLAYSTRQSHPRALVNADVELTWPSGTPSQIKAVLLDGIVRMDSVTVTNTNCQGAGGRHCRIALQADYAGSTFSTPTRKWLTVEVTVTSGSTNETADDSVEAVLVDRRATPYGAGWMVAGVLRLVAAGSDQVLVGPTGAAAIYRGSGGYYLSPPGDPNVLVWTGTQYELRSRDGSKIVFNSSGEETSVVSRNGNTTTITYQSGPERVSAITDPTGHGFSFSYSAGKLTAITDPGGRHTGFDINGSNQLVMDTLPALPGGSRPETFGYRSSGSNGAVLLQSRTNVLGNAVRVAYSARLRPTQDSLPAVLPDTGSTLVTPVIKYAAQELRALGTLVSADSLYTQMTDPLGHWTRSTLNRWGAATLTWDSLGTLARASYTPEGYVAWAEGKVADSTRVYSTYDGWGQLVRTYHLRSSSDTLRLDSLVWNAAHQVTQQVDARGKATTFAYDAHGNVTMVVGPANDTTRTWYHGVGIVGVVDSVETPDDAITRYAYDTTTWWNRRQVTAPDDSTVLASLSFDGFGRDTLNTYKVAVQGSGSGRAYQWMRFRTFWDAGNLQDSAVTQHTDDCGAPCNTPPTFPTDTLHRRAVRHVYTRLGADSLFLNDRGIATRYATDALGRVRARWPWTDSSAVVDSFRYDLAGNLRFHRTRRDTVIQVQYDSRNRRTAMVVPGIGTYQYTYAGPNDELTRAAISGYVDPIGGVNPGVSWVYSRAGLLLADTAQGNRVTTYAADRYGRDTLVTDPTGSWHLRFEQTRGGVDTVVTPFGDTLAYAFDVLGRALAEGLGHGASTALARTRSWDLNGALTGMTNVVGAIEGDFSASGSEVPTGYLGPNFEVHDTGSVLRDTGQAAGRYYQVYADSLVLDGWSRMAKAVYLVDSSAVASDSFAFDRDGNLSTLGAYDPVTGRMLTPPPVSYDRDGNLLNGKDVGGTFAYDALDRLVADGSVSKYAYDVLGRRIAKRVYSGPDAGYVRYLYRGGEVAAEADSGGTLKRAYTWGLGADNLVAIHDYVGGHDYYVGQDQLASTRWVVRSDGTWQMTLRYASYGALIDSTGTLPFPLRYRWIGREYDEETGLYYLRARYYAPSIARFIQEDPGGHATTSNPYAYGEGNPTNGRDLNGMDKAWEPPPPPLMLQLHDRWENEGIDAAGGGWWVAGRDGFTGFGDFDLLTTSEQNSCGQINCTGPGAAAAFIALKRAILNGYNQELKDWFNNGVMHLSFTTIDGFDSREDVSRLISWASGCQRDGCNGSTGMKNKILLFNDEISADGTLASIVLAHELGEIVHPNYDLMAPQGMPSGSDEMWGLHYENLVRPLFGCVSRAGWGAGSGACH